MTRTHPPVRPSRSITENPSPNRNTPLATARTAGPVAGEPVDAAPIETFLHTLARAVRQFHTYPASSPQCLGAVEDAHQALNRTPEEQTVCVVRPREILVGGVGFGRDTLVEHELVRRLFDSRCHTLVIGRAATRRELAVFCSELAARRTANSAPLADRLSMRRTEQIAVSVACDPVVLEVNPGVEPSILPGSDDDAAESASIPSRPAHLYPQDKGWVRVDPATPLDQVTLRTLARLVEQPATLAQMLSRLGGDPDDAPLAPDEALEQRCQDLARLYASLDPAAAHASFGRLASAVLALDSPQRRRLLSTTVLPGLIDGRPEGELLRGFPDVDLADALSLLLDVETAAPELLTSALDRLHLPSERQAAVTPLLEERIRTHKSAHSGLLDSALQERTRQLIRIVHGETSFHDFAGLDLAIDPATEEVITRTNGEIHATHLADAQLACVSHLIGLCADSETVGGLVQDAIRLLGDLERTQSVAALAVRFEALQRTAAALRHSRPAVATSISGAIEAFYTPARFERLLAVHDDGGDREPDVNRLIAAIGSSLPPVLLRTLQDRPDDRRVLRLAHDHAATFAPAIGPLLDDLPLAQRIPALRILALAGRGLEACIVRQLSAPHEHVVREALTTLAAVGSNQAADGVTRHLQHARPDGSIEALLWRFPAGVRLRCLRTLLRNREFVTTNPKMALTLISRLDRHDASTLADVLQPLTSLRFRFWNLGIARVGRQAAAAGQR